MSPKSKQTTPSKEELLNELESIRDYLNDDQNQALDDNDLLEIPTLTAIAEPEIADVSAAETAVDAQREDAEDSDTRLIHHTSDETDESTEVVNDEETALLQAYENELSEEELNADQLADQAQAQEHSDGDQSHPQVEQASLFDTSSEQSDIEDTPQTEPTEPEPAVNPIPEDKTQTKVSPDHEHEPSQTDAPDSATTKAVDQIKQAMPKARGENPFLPPHIRERLGKHKEMFDQHNSPLSSRAEIQGDLLDGFRDQSDATHSEKTPESIPLHQQPPAHQKYDTSDMQQRTDRDALVDALVAEYLPLIEAKLRAKLRESTSKDQD